MKKVSLSTVCKNLHDLLRDSRIAFKGIVHPKMKKEDILIMFWSPLTCKIWTKKTTVCTETFLKIYVLCVHRKKKEMSDFLFF